MRYESQLELLSHLLNKSVQEIQKEALALMIENLDPQKRTAYVAFLKAAGPNELASGNGTAGPGYTLTDAVARMDLNLNTIKGRILNELRTLKNFSRTEFTTAVAKAMRWDDNRRQFGVESKFPDLASADKGWWGTLKGKERLVVARA